MMSRVLKALVISDLYPNNANQVFGIFVHNQLNKLVDCGMEISVVSPVPWSPPLISLLRNRWRNYLKIGRMVQGAGFKVEFPRYFRPPGAWFYPYSGISCYFGIRKTVEHIYRSSPFDMIYTNALIPSGYAGCLMGTKLRLPVVCYVGQSELNHSKNIKYVITKSTRIVSASRHLKNQLAEIALPKEPIEVIYRGADTEVFKPFDLNPILKQKLLLPDDSIVITFVGWLIKRKGIYDLLNAFGIIAPRLPQAYLMIIGDGPERSNLETLVKRMSIGKRVIFAGLVTNEELPSYHSVTDIMAFPSYAEGLPNAVVEAVACGKPVVATSVGGIPEIVTSGINGFLINVGDVEGLSSNIIRLIKDATLRKNMGVEGRQIALSRFNASKNAYKLNNFFQEVIQEHGKIKPNPNQTNRLNKVYK